jgi:hypothetical protein
MVRSSGHVQNLDAQTCILQRFLEPRRQIEEDGETNVNALGRAFVDASGVARLTQVVIPPRVQITIVRQRKSKAGTSGHMDNLDGDETRKVDSLGRGLDRSCSFIEIPNSQLA